MQIQFLLLHRINNSAPIQALAQQLKRQQERCLKKAQNEREQKHCGRDRENYDDYMKQYRKQIAQKGQDICLANMSGSLDERRKERKKCVAFYMKGFNVVQENIKDKLNSLVNKLDYAQL